MGRKRFWISLFNKPWKNSGCLPNFLIYMNRSFIQKIGDSYSMVILRDSKLLARSFVAVLLGGITLREFPVIKAVKARKPVVFPCENSWYRQFAKHQTNCFHCISGLFWLKGYRMVYRKWCVSENISLVSKSRHSKQESRKSRARCTLNSLEVWNFYNLDRKISLSLTNEKSRC